MHPLDPLTAAEIERAAEIVRSMPGCTATTRFVTITLAEPPKADVLAHSLGDDHERRAAVVLYDRATRATTEVVVSIPGATVCSATPVPDVQPGFMLEELLACEAAVKADPGFRAALARRGVRDPELAMVDLAPSAYTGPDDAAGLRRIGRPLTWIRTHERDNGYARPVEGLIVTVDLDTMEVVDVEDHDGPPIPTGDGNFAPGLLTVPLREDVRPLEISQPEGPSFTLDGSLLRWQGW